MSSDAEIGFMPATELRDRIASKELSPVEVIEATLRRIESLDGQLGAYITVMGDEALDAAREAESAVTHGDQLGPLHGVPVPIKDLEGVKGVRLTHGSVPADEIADSDALCVARIRAAGGIIIGKTNTPEFGHAGTTENLVFGPCRNAWNTERTPGGSSGGAATSVAAGMTAISQGSDGGGSVRIPCAFSGIYGIKATQGRVPRRHAGPNSWNIINHSSVGPMARNVRDAAVLLNVLAGPSPDAEYGTISDDPPDFGRAIGRGVRGLRVALSTDLGGAAVDRQVEDAVRAAAGALEEQGAIIEEASFKPDEHSSVFQTFYTYFCVRAYSSYGHLLDDADSAAQLTDYFRDNLERGRSTSALEYAGVLNKVGEYRAYVNKFLARFDLLLTPVTAVPAFEIGNPPEEIGGRKGSHPLWDFIPFTYLFNLTGNPAASAPAGFSSEGLPVGLHIIGNMKDEVTVLAASAAFEEAKPWANKRPPVS